MAASTRHIIQRQTVWLDSPGVPPSFGLQERVSAYCRNQLPALLESLFDRYIDAETIIRIDQLYVDVGQLSVEKLEAELTQQLTKQIEQALKQLNNSGLPGVFAADGQPLLGKFERFTRDERLADQFRYFLINGYLPAWGHSNDFEKLTHWLTTPSATGFRQEIRTITGEKPASIGRLMYHCPDLTLLWIVTDAGETNQVKAIQWLMASCQDITGLPFSGLREHFWQVALRNTLLTKATLLGSQTAFINSLSSKTASPDLPGRVLNALKKTATIAHDETEVFQALQPLIQQLTSEQASTNPNTATPVTPQPVQRDEVHLERANRQALSGGEVNNERNPLARVRAEVESDRREERRKAQNNQTPGQIPDTPHGPDDEGLFVPLAGIVLLHPFFVEVFSEMGLLINRRQWVDEGATIKGVQLLAFLATGNDFCPEFDMPLLKLLCGLPLEAVVPPDLALTDIDRQLAAELLEAIIQHWSALGTVSPDGLREAFLQREGKLIATDAGWRLTVERKTLDILLSRLPWGYSLIKLPFMPTMLYVDWT